MFALCPLSFGSDRGGAKRCELADVAINACGSADTRDEWVKHPSPDTRDEWVKHPIHFGFDLGAERAQCEVPLCPFAHAPIAHALKRQDSE